MRYHTQRVAYPYFVVALLLFGLQMVFGLLSAAKYLGPDPLLTLLPFDVTKAIHTNLLLVWLLTGFMGATFYLVPEESRVELYSERLAYIQLAIWTAMGVTAVVGYVFRWTAGNKLLEQPLPLKIVIVIVMLMFLYNIGMTIRAGRPAHHDRRRARRGPRVHGAAVPARAVRVRQLHGRGLLPVVDRAPLGRRRLGDDPGCAPRLPADPSVRRRPRGARQVALRHRGPHVHLGHPRHRAPLLLDRRATVLAADRRLLQRAGASRVPRDGDVRLLRDPPLGPQSPQSHGAALDDRQRGLLRARGGHPRPRPHLAGREQVDARHPDHPDARPHGVLRGLRDDRARHDHLRDARTHRAPRGFPRDHGGLLGILAADHRHVRDDDGVRGGRDHADVSRAHPEHRVPGDAGEAAGALPHARCDRRGVLGRCRALPVGLLLPRRTPGLRARGGHDGAVGGEASESRDPHRPRRRSSAPGDRAVLRSHR